MTDLKELVRNKINEIGAGEASKLFGVAAGTISNWSTGKTNPTLAAGQLALDSASLASEILKPEASPAPQITMWEGKKVMILLPCYRSFNPHTHFTLFANYAKYGPDKLGMAIKDRTVIHEGRNELIEIADNIPDVETVIMIDDDMILPCGNEGIFNGTFEMGVKAESARHNAISRIMSHGRDKEIIGALYYGRHKWGMPQCDWGFNAQRGSLSDDLRAEKYNGLIEMGWVGTGMFKIEMTAIRKMKEAINAGRFPGLEKREGRWYGYFTPLASAVGEDVSFCKRMGDIGIKTYLDAGLVCGHADGANIFGPKNTRNKTT